MMFDIALVNLDQQQYGYSSDCQPFTSNRSNKIIIQVLRHRKKYIRFKTGYSHRMANVAFMRQSKGKEVNAPD